MTTRPCTPLYHAPVPAEEEPEFVPKRIEFLRRFEQRRFKSSTRFGPEEIMPHLLALQEELKSMKQYEQLRKRPLDLSGLGKSSAGSSVMQGRLKLNRKEQVNDKRARIAMFLQTQLVPNLKQIAKLTGTCFATVKRVKQELDFAGSLQPYEYNNLKTLEEEVALQKSFWTLQEGYETVTELKRQHPSFSRKRILRELRRTGFKWRPVRKSRKDPEPRKFNSTNICRVVPLRQNSYFHWARAGVKDNVVFGQRFTQDITLTAIALCSTERFLAVQLFKTEITGVEFACFLNEAMQQLPGGTEYTILADNATWHDSEFVREKEAFNFLFFNEPGMFQLNLIENAFSCVRDTFRKRPLVESLAEEVRLIVNIFFDDQMPKRFRGYLRNHVRQLIKYLDRHRVK